MDRSRRRFLRTSGVLVGTGTLASLAGCSGILGGGGGGGGVSGGFTNWLHAPGEFQDGDHYYFSATAQVEMAEYEDEFDSGTYDDTETQFESRYDAIGIDFDEVDTHLTFLNGSASVLTGYQVPREDIVEELEDNDYDDDEHEGFAIYVSPDESVAYGVSGNTIVYGTASWTSSIEGPAEIVEYLIDTNNGEEDRYVDESDAFAELSNQLSTGTVVSGRTHEEYDETAEEAGRFEGAVGSASSLTVNGETASLQNVVPFDDADDIDLGDVEDWAEEAEDGGSFEDVDDISVSSSGRSVIVTGTMDTDDI